MLENTLQLSLWRNVLNFVIVTKSLSNLFIFTIIIVIIIIIIGSINNIIVPFIMIIINNNNINNIINTLVL